MTQAQPKRGFDRTVSLVKRMVPYFKPYMGIFALDLFCALMTTLCDLVLPLIVRQITDMGMNHLDELTVQMVLGMGAIYLVLRVIDTVANYYMTSVGHIMGAYIETDLRRDLFSHMQKLSNTFHDNAKTGQLMSRITTDLNDITEFAHHCPEEFFIAAIKIIASFCILSTMNVWLTLIIFAVLPIMLVTASRFNLRIRGSFKESRHQLGELNSQVEDSLQGIRVVKSYANEEVEEEKFEKGNSLFLQIKRQMFFNMAGLHSTTRLFDGVMYILVVTVGAIFMIYRQISPADLVAYLLYVTTLLTSVRRIVEFTEQFQRGITGMERFTEVMDEPITITDKPDAKELKHVKGDIEFDHVSFAYVDDEGEVLHNINLKVQAGESVALVGPSGGGKTTMCNLLPRFYEPTSGRILIDGQNIDDVTLDSLRNAIGMVHQDVYMFTGTVMQNIEYGMPGANREQVIEAAKLADAHEFITALPDGYDTHLGERGVRLSGGQKQRISIARVFLKNPPILILDEATSALDNESEQQVQRSLEKLMKGRTTFTIAHRLTTIRNADLILVLTENGIEESGTHAELIAKHGIYSSLYSMYAKSPEGA
ncbi:ABC transporter ATP-binding protein/permease [Eubacteriales bacterium OttesenSCG-928-N13]|nr:ABC transporter ATP-binding protein/permease [Eubacteriales bacterium OttesenSCG-928-N13]